MIKIGIIDMHIYGAYDDPFNYLIYRESKDSFTSEVNLIHLLNYWIM